LKAKIEADLDKQGVKEGMGGSRDNMDTEGNSQGGNLEGGGRRVGLTRVQKIMAFGLGMI